MGAWCVSFYIILLLHYLEGKTHLLFANITGTGQVVQVQVSCVNNDYDDGITWITPAQDNILDINTDFVNVKNDLFDWKEQQFIPELSYKGAFGPIMDYKWELFPTNINKKKIKGTYLNHEIRKLQVINDFDLNFSILPQVDTVACIWLCTKFKIGGKCLSISLKNDKVSIYQSYIKITSAYAGGATTQFTTLAEANHHDIFVKNIWHSLHIQYVKNLIKVYFDGKLLLSYVTAETGAFNKYTELVLDAFDNTALWKYHEYKYYKAPENARNYIESQILDINFKKLCASFFVAYGDNITVKLMNETNDVIEAKSYLNGNETKWSHVLFNAVVPKQGIYLLRVEYNTRLAVRDVVLHQNCQVNDTNSYHYSTTTYQLNTTQNLKCSSLRNENIQITLRAVKVNQSRCHNREDDLCKSCVTFYNTTECPHKMTCNRFFCYCAKGYTGDYCEKECENGKYGFNCLKKCGMCLGGICNSVTGECHKGCTDNYLAPLCQEIDVPNAVENAHIINATSTQLSITWQQPTPYASYHYQVRWEWIGKINCSDAALINMENLSKNISSTNIVISDLKPYSEYKISILAIYQNRYGNITILNGLTKAGTVTNYKYSIIPQTNAIQTDFYVDCTNWNGIATLSATVECLSEWCKGNKTDVQTIFTLKNTSMLVTKLYSYTNYNMSIKLHNAELGDTQYIFEIFTTLCKEPNEIPYAEVYSKNATSLSVRWKAPYPPTGIIDSYLIKYFRNDSSNAHVYQLKQSLVSCSMWPNMFCLTLKNLETERDYSVSIAARNQNITNYGKEYVLFTRTLIKIVTEPEPPQNLKCIWNDFNYLILQWDQPKLAVELFSHFRGTINEEPFVYHALENSNYTFKTSYICTTKNHKTDVSIQTVNAKMESTSIKAACVCPAFKPSFQDNVAIRKCDSEMITLWYPPIDNKEKDCKVYVVIITNQTMLENNCNINYILGLEGSPQNSGNHSCFLAKDYQGVKCESVQNEEQLIRFQDLEHNFDSDFSIMIFVVNKYDNSVAYNAYSLHIVDICYILIYWKIATAGAIAVTFIMVVVSCLFWLRWRHINSLNYVNATPVLRLSELSETD